MKKPKSDFRIVHYRDEHIADPRGSLPLPLRDYQLARNAVIKACRKHGSIGPTDLWPEARNLSRETMFKKWKAGPFDAEFFILDDQLNNERYLYMEIHKANGVTARLLDDLAKALIELRGWGICLTNVRNGYLILLPPTLLVHGPTFEKCNDVVSVIEACNANLDVC